MAESLPAVPNSAGTGSGGRKPRTGELHESDEVGLGTIPVGPIEDVVAQPEFEAVVIPRQEFEAERQSESWPT